MSSSKTYILDQKAIAQKITRLAYEILEHNMDASQIILAGIAPNGSIMATLLHKQLQEISTKDFALATIQMNKRKPKEVTILPEQDYNNTTIIIIDDVSMTGRTISYALQPFLQFYPTKIQTLVLIERQQKNFPIHSDYVGLHISTTLQELIIVEEKDGELVGAYLE